jgi:hypothetical protein
MENTTDTLQIKISEARNLLPKESREAIDNVNWKLIIWEMNKKYNPNQLESLETETELLLCGILNPKNYPKELENRMHITKEEVNLLISEMDRLIFKKIQENMEGILTKKEKTIPDKPLIFDLQFANMPQNVQEAIAHSSWKEKLYSIANKYKLSIEQMGILEGITIKVMTNEIPPYEYENKLISRLTISKEDISKLVNEVNDQILKAIRELLKENWSIGEQEEKQQEDEIPLPPYTKIEMKTETPKVEEVPKSYKPTEEITLLPPKNIIEEKLKNATVSDHTTSDYLIPKEDKNTGDPTPKPYDPYREPVQ